VEDIDDEIPEKEVKLGEGEKLVLYTDGVTEGRNTEEKMYGLSRFVEVIRKAPQMEAKEFLEYLKSDIEAYIEGAPRYDDITLVVLG